MAHRVHELLRSVDGFRLPLEETLSAVAVPPVVARRVPRVEHFLVPFEGPVPRVVAHSLQLPEYFVEKLVQFGAVYSCPVLPDTSPSLSSSEAEGKLLQDIRNSGIETYGRHPSLRRPRRVELEDVLYPYAYCRVHVHPKRFPAFYAVDWSSRIVLNNPHCVIVNKPAGCQVPPRVDNRLECLVCWIGKMMGEEAALKPVHRLDTGTEGLVVLSKTIEFARFFQKLLQGGPLSIEKHYRALTLDRPPSGVLEHYLKTGHNIPGQPRRSLVYDAPAEDLSYASLEIVEIKEVVLSSKAKNLWGYDRAYQSKICLKTGRTHQIRVQLAHVGCPLLGDGLYGTTEASGDRSDDCIGLQAASLRLRHDQLEDYFSEISEGCLTVTAGDPWWTNNS